jgi:hypothetical protein
MVPGRLPHDPIAGTLTGMANPRTLLLTLGLVLVLPAAALGQSPSPPVAEPSPLEEAVGFLPPGAHELGFTDWSRIRASLGAEDVTGDSPIDDRFAVLMATTQQEAAASAFGAAYLRTHHDTWGWDTLDVDWEATYSGDGPPVSLVRLRDGTDVDAIAARYDERGFTTEETTFGTIRSHELDLTADWIRSGELAVTNTAFLDDGRTLAFSSSLETLRDSLSQADQAFLPGQPGVVGALDGASAAWLVLAPDCTAFTPLPFDPFDPHPSIRPLPTGQPLHPWTAMGIGYSRPDWTPVGRIAMGFLDRAHAAADAEARVHEARTGLSQRVRAPYADALFTLDDSRVEDQTLVLEVTPANDMPRRLFDMLFARDMTFAGC